MHIDEEAEPNCPGRVDGDEMDKYFVHNFYRTHGKDLCDMRK